MRKQFKETIMDIAQNDERIVLLFGDVSVYMFREFQQLYPERFFNLGICENTIVAAAAGMAAHGLIPFAHSIAPFLTERCYEHIKIDLCYNQFPVNLVTCGATFDYAWDGPTHNCYTDLAILRLLPNIDVLQPGSMHELDILLRQRYDSGTSTYFRLSDFPHQIDFPVAFGKGNVLKDCKAEMTVVTAGPVLSEVLPAVRDLDVNLIYFHTLKPIDNCLLNNFQHTRFIVIHDAFGLRETVSEAVSSSVDYIGPGDQFSVCYGRLEDNRRGVGIDSKAIREKLKLIIAKSG